ncbi:MAG TPA: tetratricopeptide repeat protein, partial [Herpetosiphonaceae bacterium]
MPFAPNPHFVGRDDVLLALAGALHGGARVAMSPRAAVTGLGGIGKTSVAVEVAHRYGSCFAGGVFWLSFADPAAIPAEIAACGGPGLLDLHPAYGDLTQAEQLALVREAWQRPIPRLLVFDNCEDPQLVQQWAPPSGGCRVLITSRRQSWPSSLGVAIHRLESLVRSASSLLLRTLAPRLTPMEADAIAEELGDFPLALQLAGSYLAQFADIAVAAYLAELRSDVILAHPSLLGAHDGDVSTTAHERHVGRTFLMSYQRLDPTRDALALALLARVACLAPGAPIPRDLLLTSAALAPTDSAGPIALGRLVDLGFLSIGPDGILLHRLVQAFVSTVLGDPRAEQAVETALCDRAVSLNHAGLPTALHPLAVHLRWLTRTMASREDLAMALLCDEFGYYLRMMGEYREARPLTERALAIRERRVGADHPTTAQSLNNLAALLRDTGAVSAALPLAERALAIRERQLGPDHLATARSLITLSTLLRATGAYATALPLAERALAIRERRLGPTHPSTARSLGNLAALLAATGDYGAARRLYERALAIHEQALGPDHADTA